MTRCDSAIRQFVAIALAVFAAIFVVRHFIGCGASPEAKRAAADAAYRADMLACVAKATTLEDSQTCRANVRAQWLVDAGPR
jgi:hypothetical protein